MLFGFRGVLIASLGLGLGAGPTPAAEPVALNAARTFSPAARASVLATGSGRSGPGRPVSAQTDLGFASGPTESRAVTNKNRKELARGSTVETGRLPRLRQLWDVHMRDTVITRGGDGNYYMTGSTGTNIWQYNDGIELYRSRDLQSWHYLGLVWSIARDGGWEKLWRDYHGRPIRSVWAPEIHYLKQNYYLCFGMPVGGMSILKSTTGKPEGPYVHTGDPLRPIWGGIGPTATSYLIDPTLFEDDDGAIYFTYGPAREIARMNDDLSGFAGPMHPVHLSDPDLDPAHHARRTAAGYSRRDLGFEGATLFKANGKYYLGSTDSYEGRYSMCLAVSNHIYGPYRSRHESVPGNGGTGFFQAKDGFWYSTFFGDDNQAPWREKPGLVRIDFSPDGRVHPARVQPAFLRLP